MSTSRGFSSMIFRRVVRQISTPMIWPPEVDQNIPNISKNGKKLSPRLFVASKYHPTWKTHWCLPTGNWGCLANERWDCYMAYAGEPTALRTRGVMSTYLSRSRVRSEQNHQFPTFLNYINIPRLLIYSTSSIIHDLDDNWDINNVANSPSITISSPRWWYLREVKLLDDYPIP